MDEHVSILSEDELRSLGADIRLELENGFNAVEIAYNTKLTNGQMICPREPGEPHIPKFRMLLFFNYSF